MSAKWAQLGANLRYIKGCALLNICRITLIICLTFLSKFLSSDQLLRCITMLKWELSATERNWAKKIVRSYELFCAQLRSERKMSSTESKMSATERKLSLKFVLSYDQQKMGPRAQLSAKWAQLGTKWAQLSSKWAQLSSTEHNWAQICALLRVALFYPFAASLWLFFRIFCPNFCYQCFAQTNFYGV